MDAWRVIKVEMYTGSMWSVFLFPFGSLKDVFKAFEDLEPFQFQNNCGVFCFLSYKAGSRVEMVWTLLKSTVCAPFSGPANLANLRLKIHIRPLGNEHLSVYDTMWKKVHFIGWGQRSVVGKPTSLAAKKEHSLWRAPTRKAQYLTIDVTWHRHSSKWRKIEVPL